MSQRGCRDPLRPRTLALGLDQYEQLKQLADFRLTSVSQVVREVLARELRELRQETDDAVRPR